MLNVPTGFKLAADQFKAALDQEADARIQALQGPDIVIGNFQPKIPISDTTFLGATARQTTLNVHFEEGSIVQQPGEDSVRFAERVVAALRNRARHQTGDNLQFILE